MEQMALKMEVGNSRYPIIQIIIGDKTIYALNTKQGLERYSDLGSLQVFNESVILDSTGKRYIVKKAIKKGWAYFFGYHPLHKGRTVKIDFIFDDIKQLSLMEFKETVIHQLDIGIGRSSWYRKKDIPDLILRINNSKSFEDVIAIFLYDND
jgi:hypothetical protein